MEPELAPDVDYGAADAPRYVIGRGQVLFSPYVRSDPKMSRRRRRRLRGKRKAGLLPPWGYQLLGDVASFNLSIKVGS